jgi:hypothetical protein
MQITRHTEKEFNVPTMKDLVGTVLQVPAGPMRYLALINRWTFSLRAFQDRQPDRHPIESIGKRWESDSSKSLVIQFSANAWLMRNEKLRRCAWLDHSEGLVGWLTWNSPAYTLMRTSHIFKS